MQTIKTNTFDTIRRVVCAMLALSFVLILTACSTEQVQTANADDLKTKGIIIDAGHGGFDCGAISAHTGAHEDMLNLAIATELASIFEQHGIPVSFTRSDENAIAETKEDDMARRLEIIHDSNAAIMVSIHMNSFPDNESVHGPQIFYRGNNSRNIKLAQTIQDKLNAITGGTRDISEDMLYVLSENKMPSVLIECGFLSNAEEATNLSDPEYQTLIATAIFDAICDYCGYTAS